MALAHSRRSDSTRMMPSSTWPRLVNSSSARPAAGSAPVSMTAPTIAPTPQIML